MQGLPDPHRSRYAGSPRRRFRKTAESHRNRQRTARWCSSAAPSAGHPPIAPRSGRQSAAAPAAQTVIENATAVEPAALTATGYTFGGWYSDSELTIPVNSETIINDDINGDFYAD